jgi:hypothetical protein
MGEPEKTKKPKAPKPGGPKTAKAGSLSARAERSLKDVDHLMKKHPATSAHERAMAHLEQAKVSALLELAAAIRATRGPDGRPEA